MGRRTKARRVVNQARNRSENLAWEIEKLEDRRLLSATLAVGVSKLVFNAVHGSTNSQTLTLSDTGDADLTVSSLTIASDTTVTGETSGVNGAALFSVSNGTTPFTITAGTSTTITVTYAPTTYSLDAAGLQIASNDPNNATDTVPLRGIGTNSLNGTGQPSLQRILQAYSIPTLVGNTNAATPTYPEPPASNTQEVVLQRLVKAGTGPVTITPLASFTSSGTQPFTLGTYVPGSSTSTKSELYHTLSTEYQTVNLHVQGVTQFDPGSAAFGFYFVSGGHTGYSEDQFNTYDTTDDRKFRFFPMENPDGSTVPNTYILTTTEYQSPAGYDFTNMVAVISNVMAAPSAPSAPSLGVQDPYALPGSNTVIFDNIANPNTTLGDAMHNVDTLTLNNTGGSTLTISSYLLTAGWQLNNAPAFPLSIAAGSSTTLTLQFIARSEPSHSYNETDSASYPNGGGVYNGALTLYSNDANSPTTNVKLAGWYQYHSENENEPSAQSIVNLLIGWGTNINSTPIPTLSETLNANGTPTYYGEEVVSGYWQEANTNQSVSVEALAAYHTEGASDIFAWYTQGSTSYHQLYSLASDDGQRLFPLTSSGTSATISTFSSTGIFGFKTDTEFSDDTENSQATAGGHDVRFFPVRTAAGVVVPNTYICIMDYPSASQNFDFNDNVYLISNIRPTALPPAVTNVYAVSNTSSVSLQWAPVVYTNLLGYNVYSSTSLNGTYTLLTSTPITTHSFTDSSPTSNSTLYYKVTAVDSSTGNESVASNAVTTTVTGPVGVADTFADSSSVSATVNVLANDTDNTGTLNPATVTIVTGPNHGGTATVNSSTGQITYTPTSTYSGAETIKYTVGDSNSATSAATTVTFNVTYVAPGPVANPDFFDAETAQATQLNVLANDTGSPTASSIAISTAPSNGGTVSVNTTTGIITYTSAAGFTGTETFAYTEKNSSGVISAPATVSLNVSAVPTGPQGVPDTLTAVSGQSAQLNVLSNDADSGGTINPTTVAISTAPSNGGTATVDPTSGLITYTSAANFYGTETFYYTVSDSNGLTSQPTLVTVTVINANGAPTALADSATTHLATPVAISVLSNDTSSAGLNVASVAIVTAPASGTAVANADGTVTYTPAAGFLGVDTFTYTVDDIASGVSNVATVTVTTTLAIGSDAGDDKSVVYTDADGTVGTITLNKGTAVLSFAGTASASVGKNGVVTVTGSNTSVTGITIADSSTASVLTIKSRGGNGNVTIGSITGTDALKSIVATGAQLTGPLSVGGLGVLQLGSATGASVSIGSGGASNVAIVIGSATDTQLITSAIAIRSLKVGPWADATAGNSTLSAPSIGTLVGTGEFDPTVTTTAGGINSAHITGAIGSPSWTVDGDLRTLTAGSIGGTWTGAINGRINNFVVKSGGFGGSLNAASIGTLNIAGDLTGSITAASATNVKVIGNATSAVLDFSGAGTSLNHLLISGAVAGSSIATTGNANAIVLGALIDSTVDIGATAGDSVSGVTGTGTLGNLKLTGRTGNVFSGSDIVGGAIRTLALGATDTANGGVPDGVLGGSLRALTATFGSTKLKLTAKQTPDNTTLQNYLQGTGIVFGDFTIAV